LRSNNSWSGAQQFRTCTDRMCDWHSILCHRVSGKGCLPFATHPTAAASMPQQVETSAVADPSKCTPILQALEERSVSQRPSHNPVIFKPDENALDVYNWLFSVFAPWGRPIKPILVPTTLVIAVAFLCAFATETDWLGGRWQLEVTARLSDSYSGLFVALSFLLVFRLNRAAVRYYEGRSAAGQMVVACRELASEACCCLAHDTVNRDDLCRWVVAFPVATRNYLRSSAGLESVSELAGVLPHEDLQALAQARRQPLFCIDRIRQKSLEGTRTNSCDSENIKAEGLGQLNHETEMLQLGMGAMERINGTPLPFAYVAHLRTFLLMYLLLMPFVFGKLWGWACPVAMTILSYGMLGIEAVSVSCERPFGWGSNHLPLDRLCDVVAEDVEQTLQTAQGSVGAQANAAVKTV